MIDKFFKGKPARVFFALALVLLFVSGTTRAQDQAPQLLKEPVAWAFERFPLPPVFAPHFPYHGLEELRFSPGMFQKDSATYFSYAFVAQLDGTPTLSQTAIQNYLLTYFNGLCSSTARERKLKIDTSKIAVFMERKKGAQAEQEIYTGRLNVFGVFADGAPVALNAEVNVFKNAVKVTTYLLFVASPQQKSHPVWKALHEIQRNFKIPL